MTLQTDAIATALPSTESPTHSAARLASPQTLLKAHLELGKVRLNAMVVFSTALGFVVGSKLLVTHEGAPVPLQWIVFLWTCLGTFLAAVGASAFNQAIEARRDARMHRTRNRPLCTGRLSRTYAATFGLIISIVGVAILCPTANGLTASLAAGNILLYALFYTPLKPLSTVNTLIGAVVGAIPPVLGWTAATNELSLGALIIGGILFVWQIPHFLALCWMYREDYARGGFKMLPIVDPSGRLTTRLALMYALFLVPLCVMLYVLRHAGPVFLVLSFLLNAGLVMTALRFFSTRANKDARRLFFASIIYLPVLSTTLMLDARNPELERIAAAQRASEQTIFIDPGSPEGQRINAEFNAQLSAQTAPAPATPTQTPTPRQP